MTEPRRRLQNAAITRLLQDEATLGLWTQQILGYPVYPQLRLLHYRKALLAASGLAPGERGFREHAPQMSARITTSVRSAAKAMRVGLTGRDIWVLSSTNYRRRDDSGMFENIFTEHLRAQLGDRCVFLEKNLVKLPPQARSDLVFVDALHWSALGVGKIAARGLEYAVDRELAAAFAPTTRRRLAALAVCGSLLEHAYTSLLQRCRPRAVFVLNSYSEFVPAQRAAKRLGIPLIEIQHGIIHHSHPGYAYPATPPLSHAPDHIVTFGARFGEILEETADYWSGRWTVGGHTWLAERAAAAVRAPGVRRVVFFSQPEPDVQDQVNKLATELRRMLPSDVDVVIKPHPTERNSAPCYACAEATGVELASNLEDSYSLLGRCDLAVSVYSTVALEALAFPCISAVVRSPGWSEEIKSFVALGQLEVVTKAADLVRLLDRGDLPRERDAARALFGVGEPAPDYARLIAEVAANLRR